MVTKRAMWDSIVAVSSGQVLCRLLGLCSESVLGGKDSIPTWYRLVVGVRLMGLPFMPSCSCATSDSSIHLRVSQYMYAVSTTNVIN
jgi:hypothetical protein